MNLFNKSIFSCILLLVLSSCNLFDTPEQIPAYISIDKIDLITDYNTQGSNSHKIVDAWVYLDDQPQGVYELPVTFPILAEGINHTLTVFPGVKENGISHTRIQYPFYQAIIYPNTLSFEQQETISLSPIAEYKNNVAFEMKEDFESGASEFSVTGTENFRIINDKKIAKGGKFCGYLLLDSAETQTSVESAWHVLPKLGADVYLELDFMCTRDFHLHLKYQNYDGSAFEGFILGLSPTMSDPTDYRWNKVYVNLKEYINNDANSHKFKIKFVKTNETDDRHELYFDNVKLVHYQ